MILTTQYSDRQGNITYYKGKLFLSNQHVFISNA